MPAHVHSSSVPVSNLLPRSLHQLKTLKTLHTFITAANGLPAEQVDLLTRQHGCREAGEA